MAKEAMFALKEASEIILSTPFYVKLNTLLSMSEGMSHVFVQTKKEKRNDNESATKVLQTNCLWN